MAVSDIKISTLVAAGVVGGITLLAVWNDALPGSCTLALQPAKFRWFAATTNNRALATQVGETPAPIFTHAPVTGSMYYWVAAVDAAGNQGDYYPTGATAGVAGTSKTAAAGDIADGAVTGPKIADDAIGAQHFEAGVTPVEIVASLPATGNYTGRMVFLTTDKKLYRWTGSAWTAAVPTGDLTGQITTTQIADDAISTPKLAAGAVTANELAANSVTANSIVAGAVSAAKLAAAAVIAGKISALAIDTASLMVDGVLITSKMAANAVTTLAVTGLTTYAANTTTNPTNVGTIKSAGITVTDNASVLIRFTAQQDVPESNSGNVGTYVVTLRRDGVALLTKSIVYDDNFANFAILEVSDTPGNGAHVYTADLIITPNGGLAKWNLKDMQMILQQFKR